MTNADPPACARFGPARGEHVTAHVDPEVLGARRAQPLGEALYGASHDNAARIRALDVTQPGEPIAHRWPEPGVPDVDSDRYPQHLPPAPEPARRPAQPRAYQPNQSRLDGDR